jgi:hypothetical protein
MCENKRYTQVFWGATALLNTDFEDQFVQGCTILEAVVSALDFSDMVVSNVFLASIPEADQFGGVQAKIIRGLWSPLSEPYVVKLLIKILAIPHTCDRIVQPRLRVLSVVLALLPSLCIEGRAEKTHDVAEKLGRFVLATGLKGDILFFLYFMFFLIVICFRAWKCFYSEQQVHERRSLVSSQHHWSVCGIFLPSKRHICP